MSEKGIAFFELAKAQDLEGIVAKKKDGLYHIGKRTSDWVKIKVMQDEDLLVCGYQPDEDGMPKDLILGYYDDKCKLQCRGKVYLGVSKEERAIILKFAKKNTVARPWFEKYKNAVWLKPELIGTAHYIHETENGGMRQPVCGIAVVLRIDAKYILRYNKVTTSNFRIYHRAHTLCRR